MKWIYLSPHLDDAALSCGGPVWEQASAGQAVEVWSICAGDPPPGPLSPFAQSLHARWDTGPSSAAGRRAEDRSACQILGANSRHFPIPDCIYRRDPETGEHLYASEEAIFGPVDPREASLVDELSQTLVRELRGADNLVCPLGLGGHVDHRLARAAVERLYAGAGMGDAEARDRDLPALWYYADYPYVMREGAEQSPEEGLEAVVHPVSSEGLRAWQAAVAAYESQISTFWEDMESMRAEIRAYCEEMGGVLLWQRS